MTEPRIVQNAFTDGRGQEIVIPVAWWSSFDACYAAYEGLRGEGGISREAAHERFTNGRAWGWTALDTSTVHIVELLPLAPKIDRASILLPVLAHELSHLLMPAEDAARSEEVALVVGGIAQMAWCIAK